jgi:hypothetical protein
MVTFVLDNKSKHNSQRSYGTAVESGFCNVSRTSIVIRQSGKALDRRKLKKSSERSQSSRGFGFFGGGGS